MKIALRAYSILLALLMAQTAWAQTRPLGVLWEPPASEVQARAEIEAMQRLGFDEVYTSVVPSDAILQVMRNYRVHLLAQEPVRYLTRWHLINGSGKLKGSIGQHWDRLRTYPYLRGYSLFFEGAMFSPEFIGLVAELRPAGIADPNVFFASAIDPPLGYSVPMNRIGLVQTMAEADSILRAHPELNFLVMLEPDESQTLGQWYELLTSEGSGRLYLPASILLQDAPPQATLLSLIGELRNDPTYLIASEGSDAARERDGYSAFLLLITATILGIHYAFDPTYRKSLHRFFVSNRIFIDDLVQRRTKLVTSNYVALVYFSVLGGIFGVCIAEYDVSYAGAVMLSKILPFVSSINVVTVLFIAGAGSMLALLAILIAWGAYVNRRTTSFMGYSTMVLWPGHLLFVLVLLSIVAVKNFDHPYVSGFFAVAMVGLPVASYVYTGFKLVRYSFMPGIVFIVLHVAIPLAVLITGLWWLLIRTPVFQLAELILRLP